MNGLAAADYAVIVSFFVVMLAIGLYFHRRMKNMSDFFGAGRQVPWWLGGISFYMCSFSALGFVVYSALAYQYGWVAVTIWWGTIPSILISARFFAVRWRRVAKTSPLEYIESRFDNKLRQSLVWMGLPTRILDDGLKLLAIGTIVAASMGFPLKTAIIVSGVIMISYTFMGGLWAALVADCIQFVVLTAAVIVLPILTLSKAGGISSFIEQAPEGFFALTTEKYSWVYVLVLMIILTLNYSTSWALVQRYYSAKDDKNARKVGYMVAALNVIGPPIFYIPAMVARVIIPNIPAEEMNSVYAIICKTVLPVGMLGMVIAAMFAATMSMLAGDFNAVASVLTNDVYKGFISTKASKRSLLLVSRLNTLIIGLVVIGVTFLLRYAQGSDDLIRVMVRILGLFVPPIALPMLLGMLTKRISSFGGLLGLCTGICAGLVAFVLANWRYQVLLYEPVILTITSVSTLLGLFVGTVIRPNGRDQREKVDLFFQKMSQQVTEQSEAEKNTAGSVPIIKIISIGIIAIGAVLAGAVLITGNFSEAMLSVIVGSCMVLGGIISLITSS